MRFDPYKFAETGDLEELKIKELKHCRLAMIAWLGMIGQAFGTNIESVAETYFVCLDATKLNL